MPVTSNLITGTPIDIAALPRTAIRRMEPRGPRLEDLLHAKSGDKLDYWLDLRRWLAYGETVTSASAWSDPDELSIYALGYAANGALLWITGGADRVRHTIFVQVGTSAGRTLTYRIIFVTCDGDGDSSGTGTGSTLPVVSVGDATLGTPGDGTTATLSFSPAAVVFPATDIGETATVVVTLTNTGTEPVTITGMTATGDYTYALAT